MRSFKLKERYIDVNVLRGTAGDLLGYYLVLGKLRLKMKTTGRVGHTHRMTEIDDMKELIKVGELR